MSQQTNLVRRLIAFFRKPDALNHAAREPAANTYDDFEPRDPYQTHYHHASDQSASAAAYPTHFTGHNPLFGAGEERLHNRASRLDALLMRAVQQFNAHTGFVLRYEPSGEIRYCTGRDLDGRYVPFNDVKADRRAVYMTLDSGEPQLFIHRQDNNTQVAVLCGPLRDGNEVIGILYIYSPVRSKVHRGIFDVFCDQASRLINAGLA